MKDSIDSIYRDLKSSITPARLKEISIDVIAKYRAGDRDGISFYAGLLGLDDSISTGRLFAQVIQCYHPDKLKAIQNEIELRYREKKAGELIRLKNAFVFEMPARAIPFADAPTGEETYAYGDDDFGYGEHAVYDEDAPAEDGFDDSDELRKDEECGFIEAVTHLFLGNLDLAITMADLHEMEGELDLSDYDIADLGGVEHCINIHTLNLSGNHLRKIGLLASLTRLEALFLSGNYIQSIDCLGELVNLRELDLSFNEIEDVSVLKKLDNLQYVNLLGNPLRDDGTIRELSAKGVLVLWE